MRINEDGSSTLLPKETVALVILALAAARHELLNISAFKNLDSNLATSPGLEVLKELGQQAEEIVKDDTSLFLTEGAAAEQTN
jgi:hypothetical protein